MRKLKVKRNLAEQRDRNKILRPAIKKCKKESIQRLRSVMTALREKAEKDGPMTDEEITSFIREYYSNAEPEQSDIIF